jgi:carbamoyltransferase
MRAVLGLSLSSNAAAVLIREDGAWWAMEEERYSGIKRNVDSTLEIPGFRGSFFPTLGLEAALTSANLELEDVVSASYSYTGEFREPGTIYSLHDVVVERLGRTAQFLPHHLGHAWSIPSKDLDNGDLVVVVDSSGSCLYSDGGTTEIGWERASVFIRRNEGLERVLQVHPEWYASERWGRVLRSINSLGFFYKWIAKHVAPENNEPAGTMMAMASFGDRSSMLRCIEEMVVLKPDGQFLLRLNDLARSDWGDRWPPAGAKYDGDLRVPEDPESMPGASAAWTAQNCFETVLEHLLSAVMHRFSPSKIAVAGGCFLNCTYNQKLAARIGESRLVLRPAMHDAGVALGCALNARARMDWKEPLVPDPARSAAAGEGPVPVLSQKLDPVVDKLLQGKIVGWFHSRGEFGPRALGHRSILSLPTTRNKERLNRIKQRAWFRPFALALTEEDTPYYFGKKVVSRFMLRAIPVIDSIKLEIEGGLHVDGTTRVQTVPACNPLYPLLFKLRKRSGMGALINTSLNRKGQPIVRTEQQARSTAKHLGLDALAVNGCLV